MGSKHTTRKYVSQIFLFSISSPIGVGVGIAMQYLPSSLPQDICNSVLQGLAGGTFLYVTLFEVIPRELRTCQGSNSPVRKVFFVMLGYACTCGLLILTN